MPPGRVRGMVAYKPRCGATFRSELRGEGFELASLPKTCEKGPTPVAGPRKVYGYWLRHNDGACVVERHFGPWRVLPTATKTKGGFHLEAKTRGNNLHLTGKSAFQGEKSYSGRQMSSLLDDWPLQATVGF